MHRWFHPNLGNVEAERLLLERGREGSFLVRPSNSCAGHFSLSVRRRDKVNHIRIRHIGDFYTLNSGGQFATLAELIQYYMENGIPEKNGEVLDLKRPLNSSDPTTERWFHGSISGFEAERLVWEKGVYGSFLVRESQSHIGDYSLTVRTKDEHSQADKVTHLMIRYHNKKYDVRGGGKKFDSLTELVEHSIRYSMVVDGGGPVVTMISPVNATSITAFDIVARIQELSKENQHLNGKEGFWEEFEYIQHQECKVLFNRKVGQEDRNMLKNRYRNILPYDYTRVILKRPISFRNNNENSHHYKQQHLINNESNININSTTTNNPSDSDYINASYIKLVDDGTTISPRTKPVTNSKTYIATQGPLPNTVQDFWWMIWQERSNCIVMVTEEVERGKSKCYHYWPTMDQRVLHAGPIEVRIVSEVTRKANSEDYSFREFELRCLGSDENNDYRAIQRVVQYQYYAWPDQHTPSNPDSILSFLEDINRHSINGPLVVHCSAGIGRSGALIVIDMLIDQLKVHGLSYEIDIQRIVKVARAQRSGLVQTEAQYKFIYLAIQRYIESLKQ